jgi:hypothetical protein
MSKVISIEKPRAQKLALYVNPRFENARFYMDRVWVEGVTVKTEKEMLDLPFETRDKAFDGQPLVRIESEGEFYYILITESSMKSLRDHYSFTGNPFEEGKEEERDKAIINMTNRTTRLDWLIREYDSGYELVGVYGKRHSVMDPNLFLEGEEYFMAHGYDFDSFEIIPGIITLYLRFKEDNPSKTYRCVRITICENQMFPSRFDFGIRYDSERGKDWYCFSPVVNYVVPETIQEWKAILEDIRFDMRSPEELEAWTISVMFKNKDILGKKFARDLERIQAKKPDLSAWELMSVFHDQMRFQDNVRSMRNSVALYTE